MEDNHFYINSSAEISQHIVHSDKFFPNNNELPVIMYEKVFELPDSDSARIIQKVFHNNNWKNSWVEGIYTYHHYHSITHEVLGVSKGTCMLLLGGDDGEIKNIGKGDVVVIPAGVAHKCVGSSADFECVGAYPEGKEFDIKLGNSQEERPEADNNIYHVRLPETDPVFGAKGPVIDLWKSKMPVTSESLHTAAQF